MTTNPTQSNIDDEIATVLARFYRQEAGKLLAALISETGDLTLAEDALQDAIAEALVQWRRKGLPRNVAAWLMTVSRRRAIDRLRKLKVRGGSDSIDEHIEQLIRASSDETDHIIPEERLRLIFTCCHPALPKSGQIALTLKTLCGLSSMEIARAFLVAETTMHQRLVRVKRKIQQAGIPYEVPTEKHLHARLDSVLDVIYLIFNEGYAATQGQQSIRDDLCQEAIRLGRILYKLMPTEEAGGLLALMLLHDSRKPARAANGDMFIPLDEQDRSLWDQCKITEGTQLLRHCLGYRRPGRFQIQAAISALHVEAKNADDTDWVQIAGLYNALNQVSPSPIVRLNQALAIANTGNKETALDMLMSVANELEHYQPFCVARADIYKRLGRLSEAVVDYESALALTNNNVEYAFIHKKKSEISN